MLQILNLGMIFVCPLLQTVQANGQIIPWYPYSSPYAFGYPYVSLPLIEDPNYIQSVNAAIVGQTKPEVAISNDAARVGDKIVAIPWYPQYSIPLEHFNPSLPVPAVPTELQKPPGKPSDTTNVIDSKSKLQSVKYTLVDSGSGVSETNVAEPPETISNIDSDSSKIVSEQESHLLTEHKHDDLTNLNDHHHDDIIVDDHHHDDGIVDDHHHDDGIVDEHHHDDGIVDDHHHDDENKTINYVSSVNNNGDEDYIGANPTTKESNIASYVTNRQSKPFLIEAH